jgi:hypothetical protein
MEEFIIQGGADFLKITFFKVFGFPESTCHFGGYDTQSIIEISSGNFKVRSSMYVTTGEIFEFYKKLSIANEELKGDVHFDNYEGNLSFNLRYNVNGHISIMGKYSEHSEFDNRLEFDFESDQTYIQHTLTQLRMIAVKYGDMKGIK